jgi:hypothetical protein
LDSSTSILSYGYFCLVVAGSICKLICIETISTFEIALKSHANLTNSSPINVYEVPPQVYLLETLVLESWNLPRSPFLDHCRLIYLSLVIPTLLLTFRVLANMAIPFKIWLSIIDLHIFTLLSVFIVVYGIVALSLLDTKTAGILTLIVDISLPLLLY